MYDALVSIYLFKILVKKIPIVSLLNLIVGKC